MDDLNLHLNNLLHQYPPPLLPTRKIELVRTQVSIAGPCCSCVRGTGSLTCGRCHAIKYCGQDCQMNGSPMGVRMGWKEHKGICNTIKKLIEETRASGEELANQFGGTEVLFQTPLVKRGFFKYVDIVSESMGKPLVTANNLNERYIFARETLIEAYVKCGEEALSCTAFRLAAENMLDVLCLTYSNPDGEHVRYSYCGWMVAGGMDQQALCYFRHRMSSQPLPYLDMSNDEDIEGDYYLTLLKEKKNKFDWSCDQWFHDFMLIALIKYKRLQSLLVQRKRNEAIWRTFMMGTHPRAGKTSIILMIREKACVIEKLKGLVLNQSIYTRINQLTKQIEQILTAVNKKNSLIIPGILDRNSIPEEPPLPDTDEDSGLDDHGDDIHDACWAYGNYGHAWNMSRAYTRVLNLFLDTGKVTCKAFNEQGSFPVEGYLQAAFDVDPTRFYGRQDDLFVDLMF